MYHRILVGFDGSAQAVAALRLARALGEPDATIVVAHVTPSGRGDEAARVAADPVLRSARELLAGRPDVELVAPAGRVAPALHRTAQETMCDLIVVGASRRRGAGRVILGSDAEASLHGAPCAVAVATPDADGPIGRIGVAFDGTAAGREAVLSAGVVAHDLGADLTVLGVVDTRHPHPGFGEVGGPGDVRARARDLLTDVVAAVQGVPGVARQLHEGDPVHEILSLGRASDLLVVGSRRNGPLLRLLLGSVSSRVVRRAACPVLVLPAGAVVPGRVTAAA
ncbi:universal stress protein [Patulibacter americanus]|uniref:universal stress protein n=1 Tax=Patulibacter americanus TaxID=588672 RepID=UPI00041E41F6|nr:universal stress protein [Patulibacter americanus]